MNKLTGQESAQLKEFGMIISKKKPQVSLPTHFKEKSLGFQ